jgi:hypothetical protein
VETFFWAALGFLAVSGLAGGVFVGLRAWRAWRTLTSLAAGVGGGLDGLLTLVERLEAHGERTAARAEELTAAVARLQRTRARALVLLGAVGEVRDLVRAARAFVPLK